MVAPTNAERETTRLHQTIDGLETQMLALQTRLDAATKELAHYQDLAEKNATEAAETQRLLEAVEDLALDLKAQVDERDQTFSKVVSLAACEIRHLLDTVHAMEQRMASEYGKTSRELTKERLGWMNDGSDYATHSESSRSSASIEADYDGEHEDGDGCANLTAASFPSNAAECHIGALQRRIKELLHRNEELQMHNRELQKYNEELHRRNEELEAQPRLDTEVEDFVRGLAIECDELHEHNEELQNEIAEMTVLLETMNDESKRVKHHSTLQTFKFEKERQQIVEELHEWRRRAEALKAAKADAEASAEAKAEWEKACLNQSIDLLQNHVRVLRTQLDSTTDELARCRMSSHRDANGTSGTLRVPRLLHELSGLSDPHENTH